MVRPDKEGQSVLGASVRNRRWSSWFIAGQNCHWWQVRGKARRLGPLWGFPVVASVGVNREVDWPR